jgi:outer membrane protein OmpA-like peptidoglycan-associated protein
MAALCGLLYGLAACSAGPPVTQTEPVLEESPAPQAPAPEVVESTPPPPPSPPQPGYEVAVLDPGNDLIELASHREALIESGTDTIETDEVGYYMDILEARLTQQVRNKIVEISRSGDAFTLLIAGSDAFDSNQSQLKPEAKAALGELSGVLEEYRDTRISIYGHTDDTGEAHYNQKLSERRALSVARFLLDAGIKPERIIVIGYGESRPRVENSSEENRARNRRIEMRLEPLAR